MCLAGGLDMSTDSHNHVKARGDPPWRHLDVHGVDAKITTFEIDNLRKKHIEHIIAN